jgi:hypothetical protein
MFVTGGLVGLNLSADRQDSSNHLYENSTTKYGWPFPAFTRRVDHLPRSPIASPYTLEPVSQSWSWVGLIVDLAVGLSMLTAAAFACEWWSRRRGANATAAPEQEPASQ